MTLSLGLGPGPGISRDPGFSVLNVATALGKGLSAFLAAQEPTDCRQARVGHHNTSTWIVSCGFLLATLQPKIVDSVCSKYL